MRGLVFLWSLLLVVPLAGQELLFVGPELSNWWLGRGGGLFIQEGRCLFSFRLPASGLPYLDPQEPVRDVAGAVFLDADQKHFLRVGSRSYRLDSREGKRPRPYLRRPLPGSPERLPLLLSGGYAWVPSRPRFLLLDAAGRSLAPGLPVGAGGEAALGWGLGDELVVSTVMPWILEWGSKVGGPPKLLIGQGGRYQAVSLPAGPLRRLAPAPFDREEGILGFPYGVPPLVADLDGDGQDDLLLSDPSAGTLFLYRHLQARHPGLDRVIRMGGLLLGNWAKDLDGDGLAELCVLKLWPLNLLGQLQVLEKGFAAGEFLVYAGRRGGPPASPRWRYPLKISLKVAASNGQRRVRLETLLVPLRGLALLEITTAGEVLLLPLTEKEHIRKVGHLSAGRPANPLGARELKGGQVLFSWTTAKDQRLYGVGPF